MNHLSLRKIAAATSVIIEEFGGRVNILPLMKALYLADREMLNNAGFAITGDCYVSMDNGPVLSQTYNLLSGLGHAVFQAKWDAVFGRDTHIIYQKTEVDKGSLSPLEEVVLRQEARRVKEKWADKSGRLADWVHDYCPEWEDPHGSSKPLPVSSILKHLPAWQGVDLRGIDAQCDYANSIRELSDLADRPLLAVPER